jgi:hypothetical protein
MFCLWFGLVSLAFVLVLYRCARFCLFLGSWRAVSQHTYGFISTYTYLYIRVHIGYSATLVTVVHGTDFGLPGNKMPALPVAASARPAGLGLWSHDACKQKSVQKPIPATTNDWNRNTATETQTLKRAGSVGKPAETKRKHARNLREPDRNSGALPRPKMFLYKKPLPYIYIYIYIYVLDYRARYARTQITRLQSLSWKPDPVQRVSGPHPVENRRPNRRAKLLGSTSKFLGQVSGQSFRVKLPGKAFGRRFKSSGQTFRENLTGKGA